MNQESYYHYLVNRYFNNSITREELDELLTLAQSGQYDEALTAALLQQWEVARAAQRETGIDWDSKLENMLKEHRPPAMVIRATRHNKWYRIAAAAVLLLSLGAGIYYIASPARQNAVATSNDMILTADTITLKPGTSGAVLTLADGNKIVLDSARNGLLATQGATKVMNNNGAICYHEGETATTEIVYNTLATPRGKQFQLELADGTRVWLNAASSIRFPTAFTNDTRKIEITGEAYFEVAHIDRKQSSPQPFVVAFTTPTGQLGEVQVLGTHFNINAYEDEATVKTTLLEGSVKVSIKDSRLLTLDSRLLKPGQQAAVNNQGRLKTNKDIDIDAVVAWKNGYFSFSETDMATLMRQIARWYDVEIEYAGEVPDRKFGGEISRNSNAEQVLKIMEESEVHFRIAGRKIIVLP